MKQPTSAQSLIASLRRSLLRQRLVLFISGLLVTLATLTVTWLMLSLVANFIILPVGAKLALLIVAGGLAIWSFVRFALSRLFSGSVETVAIRLEQRFPELKGRLVAAVQFARAKALPGFSPELLAAVEQQALAQAENVDFNEVVSFHPVWRTGKFVVGAAVLALLMLVLFPGLFSYSYEVYSHPTTEVAPPIAYRLTSYPGPTEWVKYRDIEIGGALVGQRLPKTAIIHHRLAGGSWQRTRVDVQKAEHLTTPLGDSVAFGLTLRQINKSFDYYVEAGRVKTEIQRVDVVDRPRVTGINLSVFYPSYTGLPPLTLNENNGSFSAVTGSRANLKIETNLPIQSAELVFADSSRLPLTVSGRSAEGSLVVNQSQSYHIRLHDHLGEINPDPIEYYVTAIPDEYPSVDVVRPGFDANLTDDMLVPFVVRIFDDYGFTSLALKYTVVQQGRAGEENVAILHYPESIKTEGDVDFNWDLDPFHLFPGDYISYYFEVADNDMISGPKITKSRTYIVRLPTLDERIAKTEEDSHERINKTEELLRKGKELVKRMKAAGRKLQAQAHEQSKDNWQQKKELEAIVKKNEDLVQNVEKLAEQMQKSVEQLRDEALMSREVLEKLEQIQKLFEDVATPEMLEAQKKLAEALKQMDPEQLEQAMKDFEMSQKELLERLERTLALLKRMQLEQKMEAMVRKAEELVDRQEDINNKTDSTQKDSLAELSPAEQKLKEDLEALKSELPDLEKLMEEAQLQTDEAKKFAEALKKTDAEQNMEQMAQNLQQQQREQASGQGKQSKKKLMMMLQSMQDQLMAMQGSNDDQIQRAMRKAIDAAGYLSEHQEALLKEAARVAPRSMVSRDFAATQQDLAQATEGLKNLIRELGRKSPFIAGELEQLLNSATKNMEQAKEQLDMRNNARGLRNQRQAMVDLNKAMSRLMESMQSQQQCQNGGACDKPIAGLESLAQRQKGLNQETQRLGQMPQPNFKQPTPDKEALKKLAGEQASIRKTLEQLQQEFGDSRQILGRLNDIAKEMKKIEESLSEGNVGDDVTERQLRIYSRMLEATRSLQRRDYSEQRQARTAETNPVYIPPALARDLLNDKTKIEDRLRQFMGEDYPPQYEEQIKAYFRSLLNLESSRSLPAPGVSPAPEK